MQQKEIKYTGITARPSDYDSPDGDLATAINVTNEEGNLKPIQLPNKMFACKANETLIYVHSNSTYKNGIFLSEGILYFSSIENIDKERLLVYALQNTTISSISSIGNMLILCTSSGILYAIYSNQKYTILGNKIPELPPVTIIEEKYYSRSMGEYSMSKTINKTKIKPSKRNTQNSGDEYAASISYILNEFYSLFYANSEALYTENYFIFPFFIRIAYRLYDGSVACHSSPILVLSDTMDISLTSDGFSIGEEYEVTQLTIAGFTPSKVAISINENLDLKSWGELISSIDIYISQPIYTMNMDSSGLYVNPIITKWNGRQPIEGYTQYELNENVTTKQLINKIKENSTFYKVESIPIKDIAGKSTIVISAEKVKKQTLVTQEVMIDDFRTHCINHAEGAYAYNNRINIFNIKTKLFSGFSINTFDIIIRTTSGQPGGEKDTPNCKINDTGTTSIAVYIKKEDGQTAIVKTSQPGTYKMPRYFYYPESQAYKAVISSGLKSIEVPLEAHLGLNGAQYISETIKEKDITGTFITVEENDSEIRAANQIKISEINTPFFFKAINTYTVGAGEILAISSTTKALSQGQFGQFPLYAFTTEGIWALEVSSTGTYSAKQPATRDVCNNQQSIIQLDGAIAFTTNQGIMLLSGSESNCISDILDGPIFDKSKLASFDKLVENVELTTMPLAYIPFKGYLKNCQMSYDYPNSRIVIFNPTQPYSYVYNLKSKAWTIISESFKSALNSYPDSYLSKENGDVVNLSSSNTDQSINAFLVTRPFKLDAPDLLKTITQAIHRGVFSKGSVKSVLYGSRDCINYFPVTSSTDHTIRSTHGSPFKYFRFVIIAVLSPGDSLSGTSIVFDTKQTNKLR